MSSNLLKLWLLPVLLLAMLTACSSILTKLSPPQPIATSELEGLLQYYDSLREKPIKELAGEYDRVRQSFSQDESNASRARLILLLTLPNTSFHSTTNALNLLNEWPKNAEQSSSLDSFRTLLTLLLTEQQRAGRRASESSRKLKEEQNRAEILRNKVNDIKSMEKNLILRRKN
ncbi:MAG: dihydrolipoamide acyltransferase [Nitrosomonadaceae bacterium]|nr:dihydrolipoamide acyltransferase [Nitrosomonadaceae bacterium]